VVRRLTPGFCHLRGAIPDFAIPQNRSDATIRLEAVDVLPAGSATEFPSRVAMLRVPSFDSPAPPGGLSLRSPASPASKTPPTLGVFRCRRVDRVVAAEG